MDTKDSGPEDTAPESKETDMSVEKVTRKARAKKADGITKATKRTAKPAERSKRNGEDLPDASELRLSGITTEGKNRFIAFKFTNGLVVRLQDATATREHAIKVRDMMSAWLTRRVGGGA